MRSFYFEMFNLNIGLTIVGPLNGLEGITWNLEAIGKTEVLNHLKYLPPIEPFILASMFQP